MKSSWIDRIKQIESLPPEKGWDQIAASLDESFNGHQFPGKLYNFETAPPANAWNKIQKSLSEQTAPVIPLKRDNIRPLFIRYAMAACLIGLISFAAIVLLPLSTTILNRNTMDSPFFNCRFLADFPLVKIFSPNGLAANKP